MSIHIGAYLEIGLPSLHFLGREAAAISWDMSKAFFGTQWVRLEYLAEQVRTRKEPWWTLRLAVASLVPPLNVTFQLSAQVEKQDMSESRAVPLSRYCTPSVTVPVVVALGSVEMEISTLVDLKPGDLFDVILPPGRELSLLIGGEEIARCHFELREGHLSLEATAVCLQPEGSVDDNGEKRTVNGRDNESNTG